MPLINKLHTVYNYPEPRRDNTKNIAIQSLTCNIQTHIKITTNLSGEKIVFDFESDILTYQHLTGLMIFT